MKKKIHFAFLFIALVFLTACTKENVNEPEEKTMVKEEQSSEKLVVYSPHSIDIQWTIVNAFEEKTGIDVEVVSKGTGDLIAKIKEESGDPKADIMWGGTVALLNSNKDCFEKYFCKNENNIFDAYKNTSGYVTSFTLVPSVLIVNTDLAKDIEITGYEDLLKPELKGKIANCDPEKSSSSYEQVINILNAMGKGNPEDGWEYLQKLIDNLDGQLLTSSSSVYKSVVEGKNIVGLTYEEGAISNIIDGAPVNVVYMKEGVICRADGVAIVKNAKNIENAKKFIDFVTSEEAQQLVTQKLSRRSIRDDVAPLKGVKDYSEINIIEDDVNWATENKDSILERFHSSISK
ncbi:extracellular solute-binding protein [Anaerosporobacter faecicola]|uniref:extracellular solute-binding protein n=1 Tax=Anaerosporobacter faecicola TaxID=2718714 RepID=UPI00143BE60D|nr:extracellular solute-binding protein [Anaerosporobacter faecicola]